MAEKFIAYFKQYWGEKKYAPCIGIILLLLIFSFACALILVKIIDFVSMNYEKIFWAFSIVGLAFYYLKEHFDAKRRAREEEAERIRQIQIKADSEVARRYYGQIRRFLYSIIRNNSVILNLKKPNSENEIDAPVTGHIIEMPNFVLYQYHVFRANSNADAETIESVLKKEITRRLEAQSSIENPLFHPYESLFEPIISVYSVEDKGVFFAISIAIADDNYCEHIRRMESSELLHKAEQIQSIIDDDF